MILVGALTHVLVIFAVTVWWKDYRNKNSNRYQEVLVINHDEDITQQERQAEGKDTGLSNSALPTTTCTTTPRLYYIDNLKSILTAIVVMHHVTCALTGTSWFYMIGNYPSSFRTFGMGLLMVDQSYFMVLFFFLSGYFTPCSLQRKGAVGFLADRCKRLLVPYFVFFSGLGPLLIWFVQKRLIDNHDGNDDKAEPYQYFPIPGHMWFVFWLLLFSIAYASIEQENDAPTSLQQKAAPSACWFLCGGFAVGLLQAGLVLVLKVGSFVAMPLTIGSLPFDILAFILGIKAKNNEWLERDLPLYFFGAETNERIAGVHNDAGFNGMEHVQSETVAEEVRPGPNRRIVLWVLALLFATFCWGTEVLKTFGGDDNRRSLAEEKDDKPLLGLVVLMLYFGIMGVACVVFCAWWLCVARSRFNFSMPQWISAASYGVYIIHPWVIVLLTAVYVKFLNAVHAGDGEISFPDNSFASSTHLTSDAYLWLGWLVLTVLSILVSWVLAGTLRKLPGLKTIL